MPEVAVAITFQRERARALWAEAMPLFAQHSREQQHQQDIPLDLNIEAYVRADEAGQLRCYTVREEGRLIGYGVFCVMPSLRYKGSLQATQDSVYLVPEHRRGWTGVLLLRFIKEECRKEGVQVLRQHVHPGSALATLLEHEGYTLVHHEYEIRLDRMER